jgi:hypothetical protein
MSIRFILIKVVEVIGGDSVIAAYVYLSCEGRSMEHAPERGGEAVSPPPSIRLSRETFRSVEFQAIRAVPPIHSDTPRRNVAIMQNQTR